MRKGFLLGFLVVLGVFVAVSLGFCVEEAPPKLGEVRPEQIKNLLWYTMNFVVFCFIVYKWVYPPIAKMFVDRKQKILEEYNALLEKKKEAEAKYIEVQEKIKNLEKEAKEIYERYVEQGKKEKERIIKEAEAQAERIKQLAELYIQQEMEKAKKKLREELAEEAVKLAQEIIKKNYTVEDQKRMYEEFLSEIKQRRVVN